MRQKQNKEKSFQRPIWWQGLMLWKKIWEAVTLGSKKFVIMALNNKSLLFDSYN